jgi:7-cyano-7-deazaguanine synthase
MCSISGFVKFGHNNTYEVNEKIKIIMAAASDRGRDAFGYVSFDGNTIVEDRYLKSSSECINDFNISNSVKILLSNNRAEPTTEYIQEKSQTDVQPYNHGNTYIVHNGTIANDKEIKSKFNLKLETEIDSAVIPYVFDQLEDFNVENIKEILTTTLIGSFALAVYNKKMNKLLLATNYKPLNLLYDQNAQTLFFSSLESYLHSNKYDDIINKKEVCKEIKPYTALVIDCSTGQLTEISLYANVDNPKALICASAGMDSTVAAQWALKQGYDITLLHFNYKCRAESKENECIKKIAEYFDCNLVTIHTDFIKDVIGHSRLVGEGEVNTDGDGIAGAELAFEWVPARNLIFLSIAAGYAEAHKIDYIILGGNLEESGAYADNELIFQQKFNDILPNALNLGNRVQILTPIANLMKPEIVKLGIDLKAPLDLTWSCYEAGDLHCGKCGPCFMRKTAFKMNNIPEVIEYQQ